jgi:hypothetical protein
MCVCMFIHQPHMGSIWCDAKASNEAGAGAGLG